MRRAAAVGPGAIRPRRPIQRARQIAVALLLLVLAAPVARAAGPLDSVVGVRALVPGNARTAAILGTEREGSGVVIDAEAGLVLTIGYLIMESASAELVLPGGRIVPAEVAAYDYATGFGLLRALGRLGIPAMALGNSDDLSEDSPVLIASFAGEHAVSAGFVMSRRDFAGWWEYLLPQAIFTAPYHEGYGGAALLDPQGRLIGIGSLLVGDSIGGAEQGGPAIPGNMFVPIDALKPIYATLLRDGRGPGPARPWLGVITQEERGRLVVQRVARDGPAARAGIEAGDQLLGVGADSVTDLADFYRKVWSLGPAGVAVPLTVGRGGKELEVELPSGDRYDWLRLDPSF